MAHPADAGRRPGVLMVHHAYGVTADYKVDAYRLAQLGFMPGQLKCVRPEARRAAVRPPRHRGPPAAGTEAPV
jgi:dienelactone hydrolase